MEKIAWLLERMMNVTLTYVVIPATNTTLGWAREYLWKHFGSGLLDFGLLVILAVLLTVFVYNVVPYIWRILVFMVLFMAILYILMNLAMLGRSPPTGGDAMFPLRNDHMLPPPLPVIRPSYNDRPLLPSPESDDDDDTYRP